MKFLKSEAAAIVLWLAASLVAAALLTPYLYDAGKALALNAENQDYPGFIDSIAGYAQRAKLDRYYRRALLISALVLLPVLIRRVRKIPRHPDATDYSLRKNPWSTRLSHLGLGLIIGASSLGALALVLQLTGAATPRPETLSSGEVLSKALFPALGAGIIEELIFRGLVLGLWLRACSFWTACIGSSVMFSFLHFLKPPGGMEIADPRAWHSGFEILGFTLHHFTEPTFFVTEFATLTFLGLVLAWCRTRTYSLWLPIGLHTGLVFALKLFTHTRDLAQDSPLRPWFIGTDLQSGILPLIALAICFALTALALRLTEKEPAI